MLEHSPPHLSNPNHLPSHPPEYAGLPPEMQPSEKSYPLAVALAMVFGFLGIHHFYLGRWAEGFLDLALSGGWIMAFALGETWLGIALMAADFGHSFLVSILLLIGAFRDGEGRLVTYPGQKLRPSGSRP